MTEDTVTDAMIFVENVTRVATQYEPRIREILDEIKVELRDRGFEASDTYDMCCGDEFSWAFAAHRPWDSREESFDVSITINESCENDGNYDGINFSFGVHYWGGLIVMLCSPYNYTEEVWVDAGSDRDVKERWKVFCGAFDSAEVTKAIAGYDPPADV